MIVGMDAGCDNAIFARLAGPASNLNGKASITVHGSARGCGRFFMDYRLWRPGFVRSIGGSKT